MVKPRGYSCASWSSLNLVLSKGVARRGSALIEYSETIRADVLTISPL